MTRAASPVRSCALVLALLLVPALAGATSPIAPKALISVVEGPVRSARQAHLLIRKNAGALEPRIRKRLGTSGTIELRLSRQPADWQDSRAPARAVQWLFPDSRVEDGRADCRGVEDPSWLVAVPMIVKGAAISRMDGRVILRWQETVETSTEVRDRAGRLVSRSERRTRAPVYASDTGLCIDRTGRIWL